MRVRHKIPSIFNLSMVDMLCCAMGCVILLWLLNARQSDEQARENDLEKAELLAKAQADRGRTEASARDEKEKLVDQIRALMADREKAAELQARLEVQMRSLTETRSTLQARLTEEEQRAVVLLAKLKTSSGRMRSLEADVKAGAALLEEERKRSGALGGKLTEAEKRLTGLRGDLDQAATRHKADLARTDALQKTIDERQRDLALLNRNLEAATTAKRNLEASLAQRDKELAAAQLYKDRWQASEDREKFLSKQLTERQTAMAAALRTLTALEKEKHAWQAKTDNRFAGIPLTGRRVIFLVDTSGSMVLVDEKTPAPHKWVEVRNTVSRLMRSLPQLEKYQVIAFAAKTSFPMGSAGKWLDHDPKTSPDKVLKTLAGITPDGGTNMFDALQAAFRYRDNGLDAIYFLSDGIPNMGEGLTAEQNRDIRDEVARGAILGKYVRTKLKTEWNRALPGKPRVSINTIGFFYESPDLGAFLWALSRENEGSFVGMSKP